MKGARRGRRGLRCSVCLLLASCTSTSHGTPARVPDDRVFVTRPFADDSSFNSSARSGHVDQRLTAEVRRGLGPGIVANLVEFGVPIHVVSGAEPAEDVLRVSCDLEDAWGTCPMEGLPVRLPTGAGPNSGSDAAMVVVDLQAGVADEFWRVASRSGGVLRVGWADRSSLTGSGWGSTATGSGASRLAGVVRLAEVRRRRIDHALALQTSSACAGSWVPPATKTDGTSTAVDCLPEGTRLRLDPALDVGSLGLTGAERMVAQALQDYGGFVVDRGGAPLSASFELASDADATSPGAVYVRAGLSADYQALGGFPVTSLQVLLPSEVR